MAVLSDIDLKRIVNEDDGIIILRQREKSITGLGYDLTIGFIRDAATGKIPDTFIDEDNVSRYTLLAGHRYLVISKEFVYLSSQYMATLHSRGSYALKGILVTSTTVDPNYAGCITGSLFNCSGDDIHIKKDNQFVTMVFHQLCTPTNSFLTINERGNPMDTQETFHGRYPNIHPDACNAGDAYYGQIRKAIEHEFSEALKRMYQKVKNNTESNKKTQFSAEKESSKETSQQKISEEAEETSKENRKIIKITFLIGNGFDMNVGLKTSYRDFYAYYTKKHPNDLLAKEIKRNIDGWSDLELELGQFTSQIKSPQRKKEFWDSEDNLESELSKYLKEEMKRIHLENKETRYKIEGEVYRSLTRFYIKNPEENIEDLKNILDDGNILKEYSFISFNFTNTLERCLDILGERYTAPLNISSYNNQKVLHIHGSVQDSTMVIGVNDQDQIANKIFRDQDSCERLIKSYINDSYGTTRTKDARDIINDSNIICIFGMSLGKTDQTWWQCIAEWLQQDHSRKLVIFSKEEGEFNVKKKTLQNERKILNIFFKNGNISTDVHDNIQEDQIYVVINADLFSFSLV